jgi:muconolactone delta-isomerase
MPTTPDSAATQTFMVVGIIRDDANFAELAALRDDEHRQLAALRSEGKLGAHYVSQPRKATFIEVIAADEKEVEETLATLPFARFFDVDVFPTAPPDEAETAHRARLSREPSTWGQ